MTDPDPGGPKIYESRSTTVFSGGFTSGAVYNIEDSIGTASEVFFFNNEFPSL
jgi:hypothetical protein